VKTISFFSYKGGVGRTMLAMQIARCLVALGKKVVVADFDFDAPGIPGIFNQLYDDIVGGIYELVMTDKFLTTKESSDEFDSFKNKLEEYLINIDVKGLNHVRKSKNGSVSPEGWLKILSSGRLNADYIDNISDHEWLDLVGSDEEGNSLESFINNALKPALEKRVDDNGNIDAADFLILDASAGITHYGAVGMAVANRQVMIAHPSEETKFAFKSFLINYTKKIIDNGLDSFVYVISRIPPEYDEKDNQSYTDMVNFINSCLCVKVRDDGVTEVEDERGKDFCDFTKKTIVHSDIMLHYNPQIRTFDERYLDEPAVKNGILHVVPLHADILSVLAELCPELIDEDTKKESIKEKAKWLWKSIYGYDFNINCHNKVFVFINGEMKNIDDDERNVAFKVETFNGLLQAVNDTLGDVMIQALKTAGLRGGKGFGISLLDKWKEEGKNYNLSQKIERWCIFDTRAGFGKLEYLETDDSHGVLTIGNAFIQSSDESHDSKVGYDTYLFGYVTGVLSEIGKSEIKPVKITVDPPNAFGNDIKYNVMIER